MIRRTVVGELDIEDPTDYMEKRGRLVVFTVGPLAVWWNSADSPTLGFTWTLAHWQWAWTFEHAPDPWERFWARLPIHGLRDGERAHIENTDARMRFATVTSGGFDREVGPPWGAEEPGTPWPSRDIIERASDS